MKRQRTRIQLCGRLVAEVEGQRLEDRLPGRQGRLLFAYLVLNRDRAVPRDELSAVLWPRDPPANPSAALSTVVSRLRRTLGESRLEGKGELSLELPDGAWVDFEAARAAVGRAEAEISRSRWKQAWGPAGVVLSVAERGLLPGLDAPWVEERRRELDDLHVAALECIAQAGLGLGGSELPAAERAARELIQRAPFKESGYRFLMEAHAARGDVARALQAYDAVRCLLRDELGTTPSAALQALHERLLSQEPLGREAETAPSGPGEAPAQLPLPPLLSIAERIPFAGRTADLERLAEALERARSGERQVTFVVGEPGIGKTRLVSELSRRAHAEDATVLYGRCFEESLIPYQAFVAALRHYVSASQPGDLRGLAPSGIAALNRLVPEVAERFPELPDRSRGDPETERYRLFEAVAALLARASRARPLVLVLDDLQWANRASLLLLEHVARSPESSQLLIVGTYRDLSLVPTHPLSEALAELRRDHPFERIELEGLTEGEVEELLSTFVGDAPPDAARALRDRTEGNPFFIVELLRELIESRAAGEEEDARGLPSLAIPEMAIPEGVKEVIGHRLSRLGEDASRTLTVASVIGRTFGLDLLERTVDVPGERLLDALEEAVAGRVVGELPYAAAGYGFSHALIRDTLYEQLAATRRARLHLRIGEALEELHATDLDPHLPILAHHFVEAAPLGDAARAARYSRQAGDRALRLLAYEDAAEHYERALEASWAAKPMDDAARCDLLLDLGEARFRAGEPDTARSTALEAAELARALRSPERLARAALGLGAQWFDPGDVDEARVSLLEEALAALGPSETALRVSVLGRLGVALYWSEARERGAELSAEALRIARRLGDPTALIQALTASHYALWEPDKTEERLETATEIIRLAEDAAEPELALQGYYFRIADRLELGEVTLSDPDVDAYAALAANTRQPRHLWYTTRCRAGLALMAGRFADCERLAAEALRLGQSVDSDAALMLFSVQAWMLRKEQGRIRELEESARQLVDRHAGIPAWRCALAYIYGESGRVDECRGELDLLAGNDFADLPRDSTWLIATSLLAEVASIFLHDAPGATRLYELLEPYAGHSAVLGEAVTSNGPVSHHLGLLAGTIGRQGEAIAHFEDALEMSERLGARPWTARTLLHCAEALLERDRAGDPERAEELLKRGLETARELGMAALLETAGPPASA